MLDKIFIFIAIYLFLIGMVAKAYGEGGTIIYYTNEGHICIYPDKLKLACPFECEQTKGAKGWTGKVVIDVFNDTFQCVCIKAPK